MRTPSANAGTEPRKSLCRAISTLSPSMRDSLTLVPFTTMHRGHAKLARSCHVAMQSAAWARFAVAVTTTSCEVHGLFPVIESLLHPRAPVQPQPIPAQILDAALEVPHAHIRPALLPLPGPRDGVGEVLRGEHRALDPNPLDSAPTLGDLPLAARHPLGAAPERGVDARGTTRQGLDNRVPKPFAQTRQHRHPALLIAPAQLLIGERPIGDRHLRHLGNAIEVEQHR